MGNFTEDLAKGFVRSAVNQVGRDGGKVISNSIYGNAHSTPIRGIGKNTHNQFFDESTNEVISPEELRLRAEAEGFQVSLFRYNAGIKIVLYIVSLFFAILFSTFYYYIHIWYHEIFSKNSIHEEICFSCTICTR